MRAPKFKEAYGFTLVELLVVIGIIALLIAILLPALNKARIQAKRTQDLSNIRQMAVACVAYAAENRGDWPLGNRGGPNLDVFPLYNDDVSWLNAYTFAYLLQFEANGRTAQQWLGTPDRNPPDGKPLDEVTQRRFCCTSLADSAYSAQAVSIGNNQVGLANVGVLANIYYQKQATPAGSGLNQTYIGFFYWARHTNSLLGPVYDQTGALVPAATFSFPLKQGQRSYSQTLLSCPAYSNSTGTGNTTEYAHCYSNDSFYQNVALKVATPGDGRTGPSAAMQGICCAYTDGSARWVPRRQLCSLLEGGYAYVYFDKGN